MNNKHRPLAQLEDFRDSCGFGLCAHTKNEASHQLLKEALACLERMAHRGAINADGKTGDGCGILIQKPDEFLRAKTKEVGIDLADSYAVGSLFLSPDLAQAKRQQNEFNSIIAQHKGLALAGWRSVPTCPEVLGELAHQSLPSFWQVFINLTTKDKAEELSTLLYLKRDSQAQFKDQESFFICSLSSTVLSYKGIVLSADFSDFFPDLQDEQMKTAICVFHQRFATNTLPQWRLAQPFQYLAHNGEVNTISGNRNWVRALFTKMRNKRLEGLKDDIPLVSLEGSDSMSLDNMLELLLVGGMPLFRALRLLIPPAWQNDDTMNTEIRAFHEYNSMKMEPWDGPAGIVMTDGKHAVCLLDRNGLRPARWVLTKDNIITLASETGVKRVKPTEVLAKGRVEPGGIIALDTTSGELLKTKEIDTQLSQRHPYKQWLRKQVNRLESTLTSRHYVFEDLADEKLQSFGKLFCFYEEEREHILRVLAESGQESVAAMGDDTPMAVLSKQPHLISDYFRQLFAQVTNPAIDPIRESLVMSLETFIGKGHSLFEDTEESARYLALSSPILSPYKLDVIKQNQMGMEVAELSVNYSEEEDLATAVHQLTLRAAELVKQGKTILILTDRDSRPNFLPIPMPMAVGAVHHHLIACQLRYDANLIAETAYARDPHQFAVLFGVGVTAIFPYFSYAVLENSIKRGLIFSSPHQVHSNYRQGITKGILKIMSKMGISTLASYRGAQLFEVIGLADEIMAKCFCGMSSRIGGQGFAHFDSSLRRLARDAWKKRKPLKVGGLIKYVHGGEYHSFNPDVVETLRLLVKTNDEPGYEKYAKLINQREVAHLRDLMELNLASKPIPLDEVEPVEDIFPRFDTAAMSLGALSPEAHETLAETMNSLGGRSNSGEGGEDASRFNTPKNSKIKQVASGRFGVTPHYLVNAEVLQIKIAQGAKPGEGGQLPGGKVNQLIARLRYSAAGVTLISPPPHHDIYSIEDLVQLIYDLKEVNSEALVSVKLVSSPGVGTIAAGVAKCYADLITISGYDGGTAASPLGSIRYAGCPWELGLSETQQALELNGLRDRVRLQTDGGLKTGLDVIKAAILGAESFGFGTAPMVAMGCKYLRLCHLNNCPTGVATQHKGLRTEHFVGNADMVRNFFHFIGHEVRLWLSRLGYRSMTDIIGNRELLVIKEDMEERFRCLDLSPLLADPVPQSARFCLRKKPLSFNATSLIKQLVKDLSPLIKEKKGGKFHYPITNQDRAVGGRIAGIIARRHGPSGMENTPFDISFVGTAGQSFGAWNIAGLNLHLEGFANDYVGKGMAGGTLTITLPPDEQTQSFPLAGNTCLYGATGGRVFMAGYVGERFAVRNSGTVAIIEGAGDHCCEYMTGGVVVVLGKTGRNFGAGMTGGFAYVLDQDRSFADKLNDELVEIDKIVSEEMEVYRNHLRQLLKDFVLATASVRGKEILDYFDDYLNRFWLVKPKATSVERLMENMQSRAA